jgi:hypothetical protein
MPFAGFDDWDDCIATMTEEEGHDQDSAENICGALQAEAKSDHGDPDALMDALDRGAGLIADVGVDLVSGVDVPAVDSKWVMTKSGGARKGHDYRATTPVLLAKDDSPEKRITYAAAMIPREPDKEGDVVATPTVEKAAHDFLKSDGGVDTDHSLIDGEGQPVESWVLKEERTFDLPNGGEETYGAGTWMLGIEWGPDAWERIQDGDLTGLSIYGMADHVALGKAACGCTTEKDFVVPFADESVVNVLYASRDVAAKAAEELGFSGDPEDITHPHEYDGDTHYMPAPSHDEYVNAYNEFAEADGVGPIDGDVVAIERASGDTHKGADTESDSMAPDNSGDGGGDPDGDGTTDDDLTLKDLREDISDLTESVEETVKEAVETEKQDEQEALAMLADAHGMDPGDVSDILTIAEGKDIGDVLDALDSIEASANEAKEDGMDDDEDEEDKSVEKRADEAKLDKGGDATETAQKGVTDDDTATSGLPSYQAVAEQAEAED